MMRSLYSGVSGLKTHQTRMDVIGNNIANVNTVGFKASSVTFSELFSQTTQVATGPNAATNTGGVNAKQIGLGTSVGSISVDVTGEGGSQTTNKPFDLKINGDSFFVVNSGGTNYFTKAGNFQADQAGNLVTDTGAYVMGYVADTPGGALKTDQVRPLSVYGSQYMYSEPEATNYSTLSGNINRADTSFPLTKTVSVIDSLGKEYTVQLSIAQTNANTYTVSATKIFDGSTEMTGFDCQVGDTDGDLTDVEFSTLTFNATTGKLTTPANGQLTLSLAGQASFTTPVTLDFSTVTAYGSSSTIDSDPGNTADGGSGAGKTIGKMIGVGIDTSGQIVASYSNNDTYVIGQIAVANFDNPSGLEKVGSNMFAATLNSGTFNGIGQPITTNGDTISSGVLEMSNVDLSSEFTDMIVTQRGFQANSRIITTSDTMIEELLSLKR